MKHIAVGTTNPAKLKAVETAFQAIFKDEPLTVKSYSVESGISAQPMSISETITGAKNRANRALQADPQADFGVGLEGGLEPIGKEWFDCGWCVITDRSGTIGIASSARIPTPPSMMQHIKQGMELGDVLDLIYQRQNTKHAEGHVGILTNKLATRTDIYVDALFIAFGRFLHPELF